MKRLGALVACLLFSVNAWAIIPENGWWWASNESGRGFNLEVQNNILFFASFAYDSSGNPMWLIAGGTMTSDRDFTADLYQSSGGQCFGCAYRPPSQTYAGRVSLRFTSSQTAVLTINGVSINVKRFDFWLNETAPDAMLGEFSYVIGSSSVPLYDGERIYFSAKRIDSLGPYLSGARLGSASNIAVVAYSSTGGYWQVLLDSSSSYYRLFRFNQTGFNRVEGSFWLYEKGSSPTGSGTFFQAFRTASAALVINGAGPGSSKSALAEDVTRQRQAESDAALFALQSAQKLSGEEIGTAEIAEIRGLESRLEASRQGLPGAR